ncbi:MAG: hypothetical protein LBW85_00675 [Deltaproteobacteria bacterium]|jgi:hypothetical protein|nr:hypothetical protein [Deltaproteobacteria bacterium]
MPSFFRPSGNARPAALAAVFLVTAFVSLVLGHFHAAATWLFPDTGFRAAAFAAWLAGSGGFASWAARLFRVRAPVKAGLAALAGAWCGMYLGWSARLELDLGFGWNAVTFAEQLLSRGAAAFRDLPPGPRLLLGLIRADASESLYAVAGARLFGARLCALWTFCFLLFSAAVWLSAAGSAALPFSEAGRAWLVRLKLRGRAAALPEGFWEPFALMGDPGRGKPLQGYGDIESGESPEAFGAPDRNPPEDFRALTRGGFPGCADGLYDNGLPCGSEAPERHQASENFAAPFGPQDQENIAAPDGRQASESLAAVEVPQDPENFAAPFGPQDQENIAAPFGPQDPENIASPDGRQALESLGAPEGPAMTEVRKALAGLEPPEGSEDSGAPQPFRLDRDSGGEGGTGQDEPAYGAFPGPFAQSAPEPGGKLSSGSLAEPGAPSAGPAPEPGGEPPSLPSSSSAAAACAPSEIIAGTEGLTVLDALLADLRRGELGYFARAPVIADREAPCLTVELWASVRAPDAVATVRLLRRPGSPRKSETVVKDVLIPRDLALFIAGRLAWSPVAPPGAWPALRRNPPQCPCPLSVPRPRQGQGTT